MAKPWTKKRSRRCHQQTRELRDRILIVCEGKKTEPNYFLSFPVNREVVEVDVTGEGANTLSLVQEAIKLRDAAAHPYNQVWCVFDKDEFPLDNFNKAFQLAKNQAIHIAYSNQCFELWYLLHFQYNDTAIQRNTYLVKLSKVLDKDYKKNDSTMYELLKDRQPDAIRNSKKLMNSYHKFNPGRNDPSTTVYRLVEKLNEFID